MSDKKPKIAVVHDHLGFRGGGERTMLILALDLGADFITAYAHPKTFSTYQKDLGNKLKILSKGVINTRVARFFWLRRLYRHNKNLFQDYDILIASGQTATEVVAKYARPKATKMVYTHTPPRRIFDQYENSKKMYPWFLRPAYALFTRYWKSLYMKAIRKFDLNIANSKNIRQRFQKYVGGDVSAVIWPPIETNKFKWKSNGDYFLSWGRIDEAKRVELIARAFSKMPDQKLKIASGGPKQNQVKEIIKDCPNIEFIGWVTDTELADLVGNCRAAVYIPIDEDAGMTQIEANAAGKPVLGVNEGGLTETIIDGETGILISPNPTEADIIKATQTMTPEWCAGKKDICIDQAKQYDEKVFLKKMRSLIFQNDPQIPLLGIDASRWEDPRYPGEGRRTGVGVYSKNIIENLIPAAQKKGLRVRIYTPRLIPNLPQEIQKVIPGNKMWTRKKLADELASSPPDYFFTPGYFIPDTAPKNSFATVHDIVFRTDPDRYSQKERLQQEIATRNNIKRSKHIITISNFSKAEIMREYNIDKEKITVIPLGHEMHQDINPDQRKESLIFYVGRIEKKKSVDVLIRAFAKFREKNPEWRLILAGGLGHGSAEIRALVSELDMEKNISLPGFISEEKKWELLSRASIYCHPGAHEGSCLPLFEAWNAQTPAIVSDVPVLRETGGEGAVYFEPGDADDLAVKIEELKNNSELRDRLAESGKKELGERDWVKVAEKTLGVMLG